MTNKMAALHHRALRAMEDRDAGQGTLEYVGMIAVAAIVALAVLQATNAVDLGSFFTTQIQKITNFGG
jgi:hypothetical protein